MTSLRSVVIPGFVVGLALGLSCGGKGKGLYGGIDDTGGDGGSGTGGSGTGGSGTGGSGTGGRGGTGGSGTGGSGTAGRGGTAGTGSGGAGGIGTGGTGGTSTLFKPKSFDCTPGTTQCSDNKDNDGDGKIDAADPECIAPCDDDEGTFATGIPGDNRDACKQDCFFDGDSGSGNDGCNWDLSCDMANPGKNTGCPYSPSNRCAGQVTQTAECVRNCRRLVPNGCDCFGCCAVPNQAFSVLLVPTCTAAKFGDANACPRCTQNTTCINTCDTCELCIGKTTLPATCNVPPPGTTIGGGGAGGSGTGGTGGTGGAGGAGGTGVPPGPSPCGPGIVYCGNGDVVCSVGYCVTGCCLIP